MRVKLRRSLVVQAILSTLISVTVLGKRVENPCTIHHDGKYYDLNPLKATKDYNSAKTTGGLEIFLNVCQGVKTEVWNVKGLKPEEVGGAVHKGRGDFAIGRVNTTLQIKNGRPLLLLEQGSPCPSGGDQHASSAIDFVCDSSISGTGEPTLLAQLPPGEEESCSFFFEWRTPYACPTSEPSGTWGTISTLVVVSLSILMLYLVTGTLYNRYVLQLTGPDQIPQFSTVSLKHHTFVAVEWFRDWAGGVNWAEGGRKVVGQVNSFSHQFMNGGNFGIGGGGGLRNQTSRGGVGARGVDVNERNGRARRFDLEAAVSTTEERTSMLDSFSDGEEQIEEISVNGRELVDLVKSREPEPTVTSEPVEEIGRTQIIEQLGRTQVLEPLELRTPTGEQPEPRKGDGQKVEPFKVEDDSSEGEDEEGEEEDEDEDEDEEEEEEEDDDEVLLLSAAEQSAPTTKTAGSLSDNISK